MESLKKQKAQYFHTELLFCDLARIQTWNLLSRNQMRYSVAPRGLLHICYYSNAGANIIFFIKNNP